MPFTQYRLLHDFGWEESGKNARQALKRTLLNLQEARWEGEVNDSLTGKKTHEDHFGIIDRVLWPVVSDGRLERLGYIFLGSWFLEQLRHEAGVYIDWDVLRDLPPIARKDNRVTHVVEIDPAEMEAANTREELARLEKIMQQRLRRKHMDNGATLTDPDSVFFSFDTAIGQDVTIGPNVVFGKGVTVHNNATILPFCHIEGATINAGAQIGPFARLRPGTVAGPRRGRLGAERGCRPRADRDGRADRVRPAVAGRTGGRPRSGRGSARPRRTAGTAVRRA